MKKQKINYFQFSVISGRLKGKTIITPDLGITRPPLSRLRKAIFDYMMPFLEGSSFLDLFSGTGSYLFEAVSRGVDKAVGVERDKQLAEAINDQATQFGIQDQLSCVWADVFEQIELLEKENRKFDLIMIAPPQYQGLIDKTLKLLRRTSLYNDQSIVLCQRDTSEKIDLYPESFSLEQERKYGNTTFTILRPKN